MTTASQFNSGHGHHHGHHSGFLGSVNHHHHHTMQSSASNQQLQHQQALNILQDCSFHKKRHQFIDFPCRLRKEHLPEENDTVMVQFRRVREAGVFVSLLEYQGIEGMMLLTEVSKAGGFSLSMTNQRIQEKQRDFYRKVTGNGSNGGGGGGAGEAKKDGITTIPEDEQLKQGVGAGVGHPGSSKKHNSRGINSRNHSRNSNYSDGDYTNPNKTLSNVEYEAKLQKALLNVGKIQVCKVLRVDRKRGFLDLSKRAVPLDDYVKTERKFAQSQLTYGIVYALFLDMSEKFSDSFCALGDNYECGNGSDEAVISPGNHGVGEKEKKLQVQVSDKIKKHPLKQYVKLVRYKKITCSHSPAVAADAESNNIDNINKPPEGSDSNQEESDALLKKAKSTVSRGNLKDRKKNLKLKKEAERKKKREKSKEFSSPHTQSPNSSPRDGPIPGEGENNAEDITEKEDPDKYKGYDFTPLKEKSRLTDCAFSPGHSACYTYQVGGLGNADRRIPRAAMQLLYDCVVYPLEARYGSCYNAFRELYKFKLLMEREKDAERELLNAHQEGEQGGSSSSSSSSSSGGAATAADGGAAKQQASGLHILNSPEQPGTMSPYQQRRIEMLSKIVWPPNFGEDTYLSCDKYFQSNFNFFLGSNANHSLACSEFVKSWRKNPGIAIYGPSYGPGHPNYIMNGSKISADPNIHATLLADINHKLRIHFPAQSIVSKDYYLSNKVLDGVGRWMMYKEDLELEKELKEEAAVAVATTAKNKDKDTKDTTSSSKQTKSTAKNSASTDAIAIVNPPPIPQKPLLNEYHAAYNYMVSRSYTQKLNLGSSKLNCDIEKIHQLMKQGYQQNAFTIPKESVLQFVGNLNADFLKAQYDDSKIPIHPGYPHKAFTIPPEKDMICAYDAFRLDSACKYSYQYNKFFKDHNSAFLKSDYISKSDMEVEDCIFMNKETFHSCFVSKEMTSRSSNSGNQSTSTSPVRNHNAADVAGKQRKQEHEQQEKLNSLQQECKTDLYTGKQHRRRQRNALKKDYQTFKRGPYSSIERFYEEIQNPLQDSMNGDASSESVKQNLQNGDRGSSHVANNTKYGAYYNIDVDDVPNNDYVKWVFGCYNKEQIMKFLEQIYFSKFTDINAKAVNREIIARVKMSCECGLYGLDAVKAALLAAAKLSSDAVKIIVKVANCAPNYTVSVKGKLGEADLKNCLNVALDEIQKTLEEYWEVVLEREEEEKTLKGIDSDESSDDSDEEDDDDYGCVDATLKSLQEQEKRRRQWLAKCNFFVHSRSQLGIKSLRAERYIPSGLERYEGGSGKNARISDLKKQRLGYGTPVIPENYPATPMTTSSHYLGSASEVATDSDISDYVVTRGGKGKKGIAMKKAAAGGSAGSASQGGGQEKDSNKAREEDSSKALRLKNFNPPERPGGGRNSA